MKEQLVTFKTAKLAKGTGFNYPTRSYRQKSAVIGDENILPLAEGDPFDWNNYGEDVPYYSMPTQSLLQKWLRDEQEIEVIAVPEGKNNYKVQLFGRMASEQMETIKEYLGFGSFEDALEDGLYEALKLI